MPPVPEIFKASDYCAGDGVADDGIGINEMLADASSALGNGRSAIAVINPCDVSYRLLTPVVCDIPFSGSPADTFTIIGAGQDSPIMPELSTSQDAFTLTGGGEFFSGRIRNLMSYTHDLVNNAVPDCRDFLRLGASGPGTWDVKDISSQGTYTYGHWIRLLEGKFRLGNIHDAGTVCFGADYTYMIHVDGSDLVEFDSIYSFWQGQYRNTVLQAGTSRALIGVTPRDSSSYNGNKQGTRVVGRHIFDTSPRNLQMLYCYGGSSAKVAKGIHIEHFFKSHGGNDFFYVQDCDTLALENGTNATSGTGVGASVYELGDRVKHFTLRNVVKAPSLGGEAHITVDAASVEHIEVIDSDLDATSGAPCGVKLFDATSCKAFVTTKGLRTRVRKAQNTVVANTLGKPGATDGQIDQLGTGDDARLTLGVIYDDGVANDFVRSAEIDGQEVQIKSDGATTLAPTDVLTASGASAGRVKKTTTGGASTVGLNESTVANTLDALATAIFRRSQY